jgi:hypothetical protein
MNCCENQPSLQRIGACGFLFLKERHASIMVAIALLEILALILLCVSMAGVSADKSIIQSSAWTVGSGGGAKVWFGLKYLTGSTGSGTIDWDEPACSASYCGACAKAGHNAFNAIVLAWICTIATMICTVLRARPAGDMVGLKNTVLVIYLVTLFCLIIAMGVWSDQCEGSLPSGMKYTLGPGLNCAIVAFIIIVFDFFIQALTPVDTVAFAPSHTNAAFPAAV